MAVSTVTLVCISYHKNKVYQFNLDPISTDVAQGKAASFSFQEDIHI